MVVGTSEKVGDVTFILLKVTSWLAFVCWRRCWTRLDDVLLIFSLKFKWHAILLNPGNYGLKKNILGKFQFNPCFSKLSICFLIWHWNFLIFAIAPLKPWFKSFNLSVFFTLILGFQIMQFQQLSIIKLSISFKLTFDFINISPKTHIFFALWSLVLKFFNLTLNQPSIVKFLSIEPLISLIKLVKIKFDLVKF